MVNSVVLVGRVGQNPEMKYFESGKVRTTFSLAVNRWDSKAKERVTDWFNIDAWDKQAEFAGEWVKKGSMVIVEGRASITKYRGKDGEDANWYSVVASSIQFAGSKKDEN